MSQFEIWLGIEVDWSQLSDLNECLLKIVLPHHSVFVSRHDKQPAVFSCPKLTGFEASRTGPLVRMAPFAC